MTFTDPNEHAVAVEMLRQERAKLENPVDRILFDNDPANGSIATRIEVMLSASPTRRSERSITVCQPATPTTTGRWPRR